MDSTVSFPIVHVMKMPDLIIVANLKVFLGQERMVLCNEALLQKRSSLVTKLEDAGILYILKEIHGTFLCFTTFGTGSPG